MAIEDFSAHCNMCQRETTHNGDGICAGYPDPKKPGKHHYCDFQKTPTHGGGMVGGLKFEDYTWPDKPTNKQVRSGRKTAKKNARKK